MNHVMIHSSGKEVTHDPWIEHEIKNLLQKLDCWAKEKDMNKEDKHFLDNS